MPTIEELPDSDEDVFEEPAAAPSGDPVPDTDHFVDAPDAPSTETGGDEPSETVREATPEVHHAH